MTLAVVAGYRLGTTGAFHRAASRGARIYTSEGTNVAMLGEWNAAFSSCPPVRTWTTCGRCSRSRCESMSLRRERMKCDTSLALGLHTSIVEKCPSGRRVVRCGPPAAGQRGQLQDLTIEVSNCS